MELDGQMSCGICDLKKRMVTTPILKLMDFERPFEVHTDASYFAIGGVLM